MSHIVVLLPCTEAFSALKGVRFNCWSTMLKKILYSQDDSLNRPKSANAMAANHNST